MNKIKVGMIRCDLHAIYYANLIQKHDIELLRKTKGHFYFYTYYNRPDTMAFPMVPGFEIVKLWDANRQEAENMAGIYLGRPKVCDTFAEVSDDVDLVFIADCSGDGQDKLKLAAPGIEKGVPTFIDKPFTYDVKDARTLVQLAKKHKTPIMSLSIIRALPQVAQFRDRFAELGELDYGIIKTANYHTMASHIHAISLAQHLFGSGVEAVECMGKTPLAFVHLDYGGKPGKPKSGVILNCACGPTWHCALYASVYSGQGAIHSPPFSDYEFPWGCIEILKKIRKMVQTGKPQVAYEEMIECIAVAAAARLAQKQKRTVSINEVN